MHLNSFMLYDRDKDLAAGEPLFNFLLSFNIWLPKNIDLA